MGKETIQELFQKILKKTDQIIEVTVVSVDFPYFVGTTAKGAKMNNIRIVNEETDYNFALIPKVGSVVSVGLLDDTNGILLLSAEVDEIYLRGIQHGGLVKVSELVDKLNNLENKVNSLISSYNTHVHTGVTTGPGSSAVTPSIITGTLTPTIIADIENDKVKHG